MQQIPWFERTFDFAASQNTFSCVMERLTGTPARLEEKCMQLPTKILEVQPDGKWSIKENIGHLTDLELLWQLRLDDIVNGAPELTVADLANRKTNEAGHNKLQLEDLLKAFRQARAHTIGRLEMIDDATVIKSALHPRLKTPMRTIDLFLFVAEHDDHHLATITALRRLLQ